MNTIFQCLTECQLKVFVLLSLQASYTISCMYIYNAVGLSIYKRVLVSKLSILNQMLESILFYRKKQGSTTAMTSVNSWISFSYFSLFFSTAAGFPRYCTFSHVSYSLFCLSLLARLYFRSSLYWPGRISGRHSRLHVISPFLFSNFIIISNNLSYLTIELKVRCADDIRLPVTTTYVDYFSEIKLK